MNRFTHAAVAALVVLGAASCSDGPVSSRSSTASASLNVFDGRMIASAFAGSGL